MGTWYVMPARCVPARKCRLPLYSTTAANRCQSGPLSVASMYFGTLEWLSKLLNAKNRLPDVLCVTLPVTVLVGRPRVS